MPAIFNSRTSCWVADVTVRLWDGVFRERIYSGNGCPLVSGAKGNAASPTRNTRHMVTPA